MFLFNLSACTVHVYKRTQGIHNGNRHALVCDIYAHTISFLHIFVFFFCACIHLYLLLHIENLTTHIKCFIRLTHWFSWSCFQEELPVYAKAIKSINIPRTTSKTYATLTHSLARSHQKPKPKSDRTHTQCITNTISCKQYMCMRYIECDNSSIIIWYHRAWIVLIDLLIFRRSLITSSFFFISILGTFLLLSWLSIGLLAFIFCRSNFCSWKACLGKKEKWTCVWDWETSFPHSIYF